MSPSDVAAACNAVPKVASSDKRSLYSALADRVVRDAAAMVPEELARAASGLVLSKAVPAKHPAFAALASAALARRTDFGTDPIVQFLNAFAQHRLGGGPGGLMEAFAPCVADWLEEFYLKELALLANAYAKVGTPAPELFRGIAARVRQSLDELRPRDASNLANAFSKLGAPGSQELFNDFVGFSVANFPKFERQHLANMSWAYAKIHHAEAPRMLEAMGQHLHERGELDRFLSQELVNTLSAFAKVRVRPARWLDDVERFLAAREDVVRAMSPVDLLYTASSLSRLGGGNPAVFASVAGAMLEAKPQPSAKQLIFFVHALAQVGCRHPGLFQGVVAPLRAALRGGARGGPSPSDWVVAVGAYANTGAQDLSPETQRLCAEMVQHCCMPAEAFSGSLQQGGGACSALTALDISLLLRALAKGWVAGSGKAVEYLGTSVLSRRQEFSPRDLLVSLNALVHINDFAETTGEACVPPGLYNALLATLSSELSAGSLADLGAADLPSAAAVLAKAGHADAAACESVTRQLAQLVMRYLDESGGRGSAAAARDDQVPHCAVVVLNSMGRLKVQDLMVIECVYRLLAQAPLATAPAMLSTGKASIILSSLTKLAGASFADARRLDLPADCYEAAWTNLLREVAPDSATLAQASLADVSLLLFSQASALAGARQAQRRLRSALLRGVAACVDQVPRALQAVHGSAQVASGASAGALASEELDRVASCSQILTGLQCLALLGPASELSAATVRALPGVLDAVQQPLVSRTTLHRREGETAGNVLDALEAICKRPQSVGFSAVPALKSEASVGQYFVDIAVFPAGAATGAGQAC